MTPDPTIQAIFVSSLTNVWMGFVGFLPRMLGAVIVLVVGWVIAIGLQGLVIGVLRALKLNELFENSKVRPFLHKAGLEIDAAKVLGWLVKWFFMVVFLITAANILEWTEVTNLLRTILFYIPNVIIAVVIMFAGVIIAQAIHTTVAHIIAVSGVASASTLATLAKWSIIIFSFLAALSQLGIASDLIQILFTGLVFMLAIAGGLAFGLGGKEEAQHLLAKLRKDLNS